MNDYNRIVDYYGAENQITKTFEELGELITSIAQYFSKNASSFHILEEMADVYIMLEQLKIIFNFDDRQVERMIKRKLDRTITRVDEEMKDDIKDWGL